MLLSANEKSRYNREVHFGPVAQWLEQSTHNRLAAGSNPAGPTIFLIAHRVFFIDKSFIQVYNFLDLHLYKVRKSLERKYHTSLPETHVYRYRNCTCCHMDWLHGNVHLSRDDRIRVERLLHQRGSSSRE